MDINNEKEQMTDWEVLIDKTWAIFFRNMEVKKWTSQSVREF